MKRRNLLFASSGIAVASLFTKSSPKAIAITPATAGETVPLASGLTGYYVAPRTAGKFPAVIVIMEAFGLNAYVKDICHRLAREGYAALAPDFYHGDIYEYTDLNGAIAKLKTLDDDTVMTEMGHGLEFLSKRSEVIPGNVGTLGFCMGGRLVYLACATHAAQLKAGVAYYGGGIAANPDPLGRKALLDYTEAIQAPIMLMYGSEDQLIAADEHQRVALSLSTHKKRYVISVFPGAQHGFFSDRRDSYNPAAAEESWEMTLSFLSRHLA